jgi:hypothetical protein
MYVVELLSRWTSGRARRLRTGIFRAATVEFKVELQPGVEEEDLLAARERELFPGLAGSRQEEESGATAD